MSSDSEILQDLAAREAIRQCLFRYCRGIDRLNADLIRSAYWPDAYDNHLEFAGTTEEFIEYSIPKLKAVDLYMHMIGNTLIDVQGDRAYAESYLMSYHRATRDGEKRDVLNGGRYLDEFERRGTEWRIIKRFVMLDWSRNLSDPSEMMTKGVEMELRYPDDRSFNWLAGK